MRVAFLKVAFIVAAVVVAGAIRPVAEPALAAHHFAEISEVMFGLDGDPDIQYVEVNMQSAGQNIVIHSRLTLFNSDRTFNAALIADMPANVLSGANRKWIMGTTELETAVGGGFQVDFEFPAAAIPSSGMVCWGSPATVPPVDPNSWVYQNPNNYVDCVAWGNSVSAPLAPPANTASSYGPGDCRNSLTRMVTASVTPPDPPSGTWANTNSLTQFDLAVPSPRNNANTNGTLTGVTDGDADGALDCQETAAGSTTGLINTDGDACTDGQELGLNQLLGGRRNPVSYWDFFDATGPGGVLDGAISGIDFFAVLGRFPAQNIPPFANNKAAALAGILLPVPLPPAYHARFDRRNPLDTFKGYLREPWDTGMPNDAISGLDFFLVLAQFNHEC